MSWMEGLYFVFCSTVSTFVLVGTPAKMTPVVRSLLDMLPPLPQPNRRYADDNPAAQPFGPRIITDAGMRFVPAP